MIRVGRFGEVRHGVTKRRWACINSVGMLVSALIISAGRPVAAAEPPPRLEFLHLVAHWDQYGDPGYLPFLEEARPELVQVGFYGAHFYSLAHTPHSAGYPAHFPVRGLKECGDWFTDLNRKVHGLNLTPSPSSSIPKIPPHSIVLPVCSYTDYRAIVRLSKHFEAFSFFD